MRCVRHRARRKIGDKTHRAALAPRPCQLAIAKGSVHVRVSRRDARMRAASTPSAHAMVYGEVAERFKAAVLKTAVGSRPPRVRIPPSPPSLMCVSGSSCDAVGSQRSREGENPRGSTQASGTPADAAGSPALARGVRRRMRRAIPPSPPSLMCASGSFCDAVGSQQSREGENPRGSTQASGSPADAAGSPALARGVRRRMRRANPSLSAKFECLKLLSCAAVGSQQ